MLPILPETTSKHVGTSTELTCLIPIKQGFLPTFDTWTYAGRLRVVFKVLHALRQNSRESRSLKPVLDIVDEAGTVHGFTWALVGEQHLLLNVVFDRPWEPYIRVVWRDLGPLLDLFLCNCVGFEPSTNGFERFAQYVRQHQIDAAFFYPASSLSIDDQRYLTQFEKAQRDDQDSFAKAVAELTVRGPALQAKETRKAFPLEARIQWMLALEALFGLRNLFPQVEGDGDNPDPGDHEILRNGARQLLLSSKPDGPMGPTPAIEWLELQKAGNRLSNSRPIPRADIQGGILSSYKRVSHGCMLLARVERPERAGAFLSTLAGDLTTEANKPEEHGICLNVAFTHTGLQRLGVSRTELLEFPKEFREGMEARAGLLGDVRENHPDRWILPKWNVDVVGDDEDPAVRFLDDVAASAATRPPIRTSAIDVVITLHAQSRWDDTHEWNPSHPLHSRVMELCQGAAAAGVRVMSMQPLRRFTAKREKGSNTIHGKDHFDLVDGISQPDVAEQPAADQVRSGELLVGYESQRDPDFEATPEQRHSLQDSGTFLVVRKLRQNVGALNKAIANAPADLQEELLGRMVGRRKDGSPLHEAAGSSQRNDFTFDGKSGLECPFHSHIRRANPRLGVETKPPIPVIARRGMSYGPHFDERPDVTDRGMMFMAYNASIAEQFEIIQRWMSGGNTPAAQGVNGTFGGQPDPLLGLPDPDGRRTYRFIDSSGKPRPVDLGAIPFVSLEWGLYLFTPSLPALRRLADGLAPNPADRDAVLRRGREVIKALRATELPGREIEAKAQWAALLEGLLANQSGTTAAVFTTIRHDHGGVLRTPYGVVVASHDLGMKVLGDDAVFSVREYQRRFAKTVGEGYLGMDDGPEYRDFSTRPNQALQLVSEAEACAQAYGRTEATLAAVKKRTVAALGALAADGAKFTGSPQDRAVPVGLEPVIDSVLGQLAKVWFDLPDGTLIVGGGQIAPGDRTLRCPASFIPASRYVFSSPHPRPEVSRLAEDQGSRLLVAVRAFVAERRDAQRRTGDPGLTGVIAQELFKEPDDDKLARILLGLVFGFVPTVYGNALQVLGAWLADETFWRLQQAVLAVETLEERVSLLQKPIEHAMQLRPVPGLLHREATRDTAIGNVEVKTGDRVVLAMGGMTQDLIAQGRSDVTTVFGGDRSRESHPTHACPGTHLAMGVLTGMMAAILSTVGVAAPTPSLVTVRVSFDAGPGEPRSESGEAEV